MQKKKVLFVDDDPAMRQLLSVKLRRQNGEWELELASSAQDGLKLMSDAHFDVVISDIEMPGMTGVEFLNLVKDRHPYTVRILHSGQSSKEVALRSVESSHRYFKKTGDVRAIKACLRQAFIIGDMVHNPRVRELVSSQGSLPSIPRIYSQLMEEVNSPEPSIRKIGQIISEDIGMSANILKLVNSAYFVLPKQIAAPEEAVKYLGLNTLRAVVLAQSVFSQFSVASQGNSQLQALYEHSFQVGHLAKTIAAMTSAIPAVQTNALIAGMLHDLGKLLLALNLGEEYLKILAQSEETNMPLCYIEQEALGATHAQTGAYLLGIWGLPCTIVEAIAFHHEPAKLNDPDAGVLACVFAANSITHATSRKTNECWPPEEHSYLENAGILDACEKALLDQSN